jgi:glutathione S-transferase
VAICWYLESLYPQQPLFGVGPLHQAQVLSWDHYIFTEGLLVIAEALRNSSAAFKDRALPGPDPYAQIPELAVRGRQRLHGFWQALEQHLERREFIVGEALTLADIDAITAIGFAGWIKERVPESLPRLHAWHQRTGALLGIR